MYLGLIFLAFTGLIAAESPWKLNQEYRYDINSRTLTTLPDLKNQYVGVLTRGKLILQTDSDNMIIGKLMDMEHAHFHDEIDRENWNLETVKKDLNFQPNDLEGKMFVLRVENGLIQTVYVDENITNDEMNQLKAIISQLQIVKDEKYLIKKRSYNQMPEDNMKPQGLFNVMEPTITGECETVYDIEPVPPYMVENMYADWISMDRMETLNDDINFQNLDEETFQIVKTMNYSNCNLSRGYHYGITEDSNLRVNTNQMGSFLSKSSVTKILAKGNWKNFNIMNSYTTNRVVVSPAMYQDQQSEVISQIQLRLVEEKQISQKLEKPQKMIDSGNLVYRYNIPSDKDNKVVTDNERQHQNYENIIGRRLQRRSLMEEQITDPTKKYNHQRPSWYKKLLSGSSSSSSSSSSSAENDYDSKLNSYYQPTPNMEDAPEIPLYHYTVGNRGRSIQIDSKMNLEKEAIKLAMEISEDVQLQNEIPKRDTLQKFDILSDLIRVMNLQQIQNVQQQLQTTQNEQDETMSQTFARKAFQDAVAVAGTGPAVKAALSWISENKVKGFEAESLLQDVLRNVRIPNEQMMKTIFEFIRNEQIAQKKGLYSVAITSFTNLLRKAHVNKRSAYNHYPANAFMLPSEELEMFITKEIIPYLSSRLRQSVEQKQRDHVLLYLRAIGNLGHQDIVQVYEEYLENNDKLTPFQRTALVLSLDKLAKVRPRLARNVLFKISTNVADEPETRSIAVLLLMRADPTVAMLQRLAQMTNDDPSETVQSITKSAIESAAELKDMKRANLANNAKTVRHLLNPRMFNFEHSKTYVRDYVAREMNLVHEHELTHIIGDDHVIPKGIFYEARKRYGGLEAKTSELQAIVSSVEELLKFLPNDKSDGHDHRRNTANDDSEWSTHRIAKKLHMEPDAVKQLEGQILLRIFGRENFLTFDEKVLKDLPRSLVSESKLFKEGERLRYNKMYSRKQIVVAFPLATGYPFIYTFNMPTLLQAMGNVQVKTTPDIVQNPTWETIQSLQALNVSAKVHLVFSTDQIAKTGFITPFDRQRYVAGSVRKSYVHLPLNLKIDLDLKQKRINGKLTAIDSKKNFNMVEASSWPFTLRKDVFDLRPAAEAKDVKLIVSHEPYSYDKTLGEKSTGMAFNIHLEHHYPTQDRTEMLKTFWNQGIKSLSKLPLSYKNLMERILNNEYASYWSMLPNTYVQSPYNSAERRIFSNFATLPYLSELNLDEFIRMQGILSFMEFSFADVDTLQQTARHPGILKAGNFPWPLRTLDHYRYNVMYDASRSVNQMVKFSLNLDKIYNADDSVFKTSRRVNGPSSYDDKKLAIPQDVSPNSEHRRQQFLENAAYGIKQASSVVFDASLVFEGNERTEYVATVSQAQSPVDERSRVLIYVGTKPLKSSAPRQISLTLTGKYPKKSMLNFQDALKNNDKSEFKAHIHMGDNIQQPDTTYINLKGNMEQTDRYRNYLVRENPVGKRCMKEISAGKYQMPSCLNATYWANLQDYIKLSAEIEHSSNEQIQKRTREILRVLEKIGYWNLERNMDDKLKSNRFETELEFAPTMSSVNLSIASEDGKYMFKNLPVDMSNVLSFVNNGKIHFDSREIREDRHTCAAEGNTIITFDKNVLKSDFKNCWYAMVQTKINPQDLPVPGPREISVLVRDVDNSQQRELLVVVAQPVGKDHVIQFTAGNSKVRINGKENKVSRDSSIDVYDENSKEPTIRVYQQVKNENMIQIGKYLMSVYFDGNKIRIHLDPSYRGSTYGLCGTFTGEKFDDFMTPKKCLVTNKKLFMASWALEDESCSNEAKQLKAQAEQIPCSKLQFYTGNFITRTETRRDGIHSKWTASSSSSSSSEEKYKKQDQYNNHESKQVNCNVKEQIQFIENRDKICFTMDVLPACPKHCTAQRKVEKSVKVHCRNKTDSLAQLYKQQILKGVNPDISSKPASRTVTFNVPTECIVVH